MVPALKTERETSMIDDDSVRGYPWRTRQGQKKRPVPVKETGVKGRIRVITAGGTIDKDYNGNETNHGYNFEIGRPAWHSIAERAKIPYTVTTSEACRKDSLDMTDADRDLVVTLAEMAKEDRIIVTHGTDTIHVTAERLSHIAETTIVLTGAMKPAVFKDTDADFNVGMAVGAVMVLPPGVYIALYGKVVPWNQYTPR